MFAKNFNKTGAFKAFKAYEDDTTIQTMVYAKVIREHWERGDEEHNLCRCRLGILCPFEKMVEVYRSIADEVNFCINNVKMNGCLKNFLNVSGKLHDASYDTKDIINNHDSIFLEFEHYCIKSPLTDEELLEIIEDSYENVAEAIWEKHRVLLKEKLKNKKLELFAKLLDKEVDIEQIGKEYNKYSDELNEELMKSYEVLLKKPNEEIQVVKALKE